MSTTSDAARKVALYNAPGYLDVQRARAALWLLEQIDGDHLTFDSEDREDWCRSICKDALAASLGAAEQKIADAVNERATTTEPPPRVVPLRPKGHHERAGGSSWGAR
jgi:hypothetical protein